MRNKRLWKKTSHVQGWKETDSLFEKKAASIAAVCDFLIA